jgi:hypothetical protein
VVNVDLPWNPAVLEQRIGRAHRMGQARPVHAYVLVTDGTIEENLLATLSAKHALALAALDPDSDVERVELASGMDELKRRLEVLLGARADAPVDERARAQAELDTCAAADRKQRVAEAGGQLLAAAVRLLGELLPAPPPPLAPVAASPLPPRATALTAAPLAPASPAAALVEQRAGALDHDAAGRPVLSLTLPDRSTLDGLAHLLGHLFARVAPPPADPAALN